MVQLTEKQIEDLKKLAQKETTTEENFDDWNPRILSGSNFDFCYWVGYNDAKIENARSILDLFNIKY